MFESLIPIILGITEVGKRLGIPTQYSPLIAILIGVVFAGLISGFDVESILQGIVYGLSASGLWSGTKSILSSK